MMCKEIFTGLVVVSVLHYGRCSSMGDSLDLTIGLDSEDSVNEAAQPFAMERVATFDAKACVETDARVFDLRNGAATEAACKAKCIEVDNCKLFSGVFNRWCIGCKSEEDFTLVNRHTPNAIAFKKKAPTVSSCWTYHANKVIGAWTPGYSAAGNRKHCYPEATAKKLCSSLPYAKCKGLTTDTYWCKAGEWTLRSGAWGVLKASNKENSWAIKQGCKAR